MAGIGRNQRGRPEYIQVQVLEYVKVQTPHGLVILSLKLLV